MKKRKPISEELNDILNDTWYKLDLSINQSMYHNHNRSVSQKIKKQNLQNLQISNVYKFFKNIINQIAHVSL